MKLRCPKCGSNKKLNLELGGWVGPYFRCQDCKFGSTIIDIFLDDVIDNIERVYEPLRDCIPMLAGGQF